MLFPRISRAALWMKVFLIAIVALAGCGNDLTGEQALASVTNLPEFSTTMGSTPHPADVRIDGIYHENSGQATVHATFSYPIAGPSPDEGCSVRPGNNILEDCQLYTKMVRYGGRWAPTRANWPGGKRTKTHCGTFMMKPRNSVNAWKICAQPTIN
jgi:hypothetical protein